MAGIKRNFFINVWLEKWLLFSGSNKDKFSRAANLFNFAYHSPSLISYIYEKNDAGKDY